MDKFIECKFKEHGDERYGLNVNGTRYSISVMEYQEYIKEPNLETRKQVEEWIDSRLMPYMTRKTINYSERTSYGLKHVAERELGFYVSNEQIKYILAMKGVRGEDKHSQRIYPINLCYPLSSKFSKTVK